MFLLGLSSGLAAQAPQFERLIGSSGGYGWSADIEVLPDGNVLLLGSSMAGPYGELDFYLLKMTPDGDTLWSRYYGGVFDDRAYKLKPTPDGGLLLLGTTFSADDLDGQALLIRTTADGTLIWQQTYGTPQYSDRGRALTPTPDGGVLIGYHHNPDTAETNDFGLTGNIYGGNSIIAKLSSDGTVEWEAEFVQTSVYDVLVSSTGEYAATGLAHKVLSDINTNGMFFARLSTTGTVLVNKFIQEYGGYAIFEVTGGSFMIASPYWDAALVRLNASGNLTGIYSLQWPIEGYSGISLSEDIPSFDAVRLPNGEFALLHDLPVAMWRTAPAVSRFSATASYLGSEFVVDTSLGQVFTSALARATDGNWYVTGTQRGLATHQWYEGNTSVQYASRHTPDFEPLWTKQFGTAAAPDLFEALVALPTPDGGYLAAGNKQKADDGWSRPWVVRLDAQGQPLWEKVYGDTGNVYGRLHSFVAMADGNYVLGLVRYDQFEKIDQLVKIDAAGNLLWAKDHPAADASVNQDATRVIATSDGGLALVDYEVTPPGTYYKLQLERYNAAGDILWNQSYHLNGASWYGDYTTNLDQTSDGGFLITGFSTHDVQYYDGLLIKTNAQGHLEWKRNYGGANGLDLFMGACELTDGSFVAIGTRNVSSVPLRQLYHPWIVHVAANGDSLGGHEFVAPNPQDFGFLNDVAALPDGGYVVAGSMWNHNRYGYHRAERGLLARLSPLDEVLWEHTYRGEHYGRLTSVAPLTDGGFLASGRTVIEGAANAYILRTGPDGIVPLSPRPARTLPALACWPNPVRDVTRIVFSGPARGSIDVTVATLAGQTVLHRQIDKHGEVQTLSLDCRLLPAGEYVVTAPGYGGVRLVKL
jgi:uncharacterized delta-60 repeat protein